MKDTNKTLPINLTFIQKQEHLNTYHLTWSSKYYYEFVVSVWARWPSISVPVHTNVMYMSKAKLPRYVASL